MKLSDFTRTLVATRLFFYLSTLAKVQCLNCEVFGCGVLLQVGTQFFQCYQCAYLEGHALLLFFFLVDEKWSSPSWQSMLSFVWIASASALPVTCTTESTTERSRAFSIPTRERITVQVWPDGAHHDDAVVLGAAGSGKTTAFTRRLPFCWAKGELFTDVELLFVITVRNAKETSLGSLLGLRSIGLRRSEREDVEEYLEVNEDPGKVVIVVDGKLWLTTCTSSPILITLGPPLRIWRSFIIANVDRQKCTGKWEYLAIECWGVDLLVMSE